MRAVDVIQKKRDRQELTREEIAYMVQGYTREEIADYQFSALLMAIFLNGMTKAETQALTEEMLYSGTVLDLGDLAGAKVDKHSTGGVGDKTSIVIAPLVAEAGVYVPMISGRGLGHTGGTLDKLESIPGFNVNLSLDRFRDVLQKVGMGLIGQTKDIAPADKKIYSLRDVTATVESIPLISASIMSKKLAEGIDGLVLDVKTGRGAFMKTVEDSLALAESLVGIGRGMGKKVNALITDMNQPLGKAIGNSLEIIECIETLKGNGPADLAFLCAEFSDMMICIGGKVTEFGAARTQVNAMYSNGKALERLQRAIELQGGDPRVCDDYSLFPTAKNKLDVKAKQSGFIAKCDALDIGVASMLLGAGRERIDSIIDHAVGVTLNKKVGDEVEAGEPLCTVHYNDDARLAESLKLIERGYVISEEQASPEPIIRKLI
ncbi:MAG TPA: thymidine phosphorylase [Blastocatellia bacterium]|nr:thymidine phosphorylase [Blastocatellia bacterium]